MGSGDDESSWRPQKVQRRMWWIEVLMVFEGCCLLPVEYVQKVRHNYPTRVIRGIKTTTKINDN